MPSTPVQSASWQTWAFYGLFFFILVTITYDHSKVWNNPLRGDQDLDLTLGLKIRHFEVLSDGYHWSQSPALWC